MALIMAAVSLIILSIIYRRMIQRGIPSPIEKSQAIVPVVLGVLSTPFSFVIYLAIAAVIVKTGFSTVEWPSVIRSLLAAFLQAGIPEEIAKLLLMLLSLRIFKSKVKNVYEYVLIGAAVGFGFTLFEEFLYGSGDLFSAAGRLVTLAAHMIFGMIMGKHLAFARYNKKNSGRSVSGEYAKAVLIPMGIHTVYDAFTSDNRLISAESDVEQLVGFGLGVIVIIVLFILQFKVIREFMNNAQKYSDMMV